MFILPVFVVITFYINLRPMTYSSNCIHTFILTVGC